MCQVNSKNDLNFLETKINKTFVIAAGKLQARSDEGRDDFQQGDS